MNIKYDSRNYRKHSDKNKDLINKSLKECGAGRSIVVDNEDNIIAGNGIYEQAQKLGIKTKVIETDGSELVVVKRTDLATDDDKRKQLAVMDNSTSDSSDFDIELLRDDFEIDTLADWGIDIELEIDDKEIIEDEVPEEVETRCKKGDVWALGEHRLMCGDSTNYNDVAQLMDGELADLLITDPPYNVDYVGKTKDKLKIENDKMSDSNFREFLYDAFVNADTVMKPGAVFYIWHADSEGYNFRGACKDAGWQVRQCLIWNKNQMVMGRQDYQWKHEPCLYGWKDGASHLWAADRKQTTVIDFNKPQRNGEHPTMKPVGLFDYQIKNNTKGADVVLDLFGGSGTTLIACEQDGRKARLMELDPHYCDVIIKRWENLTGKEATLCS